jgi:hypothetical protein
LFLLSKFVAKLVRIESLIWHVISNVKMSKVF